VIDDPYFTVRFELGKVVVFSGVGGKIKRVTFDLKGQFEERLSNTKEAGKFAGYLRGLKTAFDFEVDLSCESPFRRRVYRKVMEIPYGSTSTYGAIASLAGRPGGARAVGQAMATNRLPLIIPCHRVVSKNGEIGGFSSGVDLKRYLLRLEGLDY
jgi:methylated-DNA-[protein]-cysteine S-methyltransferase